jgi:hypothetical protein
VSAVGVDAFAALFAIVLGLGYALGFFHGAAWHAGKVRQRVDASTRRHVDTKDEP